jgi:hypothetical protein
MSPEVNAMKTPVLRTLVPLLLLALAAGPAAAQKLYRWVDENGQVHYGDRIPPQYADQDRDVLNQRGVAVGREEGAETPEEARARMEQEKAAKAIEERAQRDRMLLQTYQNVDEIEMLRERRIDLIDSQMIIQEQSLKTLRQRHADQLARAQRFAPRNTAADAPPMPEGLAEDIARSESDIQTQERNLQKKRDERAALNAQFDADVRRFKELRGL